MTFDEAAKRYTESLKDLYDAGEANALFFLTAAHFCGISRSTLLLKRQDEIPAEGAVKVIKTLGELMNARPIQYIIGEASFCGFTFKVDPSVLIPRPETEELVHWIVQDQLLKRQNKVLRILDIGTGSGCIAVSLKKLIDNAKVCALDNSAASLATARKNAEINDADVGFILADILETPASGNVLPGQPILFDLIVSNPPYITDAEKADMHRNVIENEPHAALFAAGSDPLIFYRAIALYAAGGLVKGGELFLEINESMGGAVRTLLGSAGFSQVELRKDLNGKDRMVKAVFS